MKSTLNAIAPRRQLLFRKELQDKKIGLGFRKKARRGKGDKLLVCYAGLAEKLGIAAWQRAVENGLSPESVPTGGAASRAAPEEPFFFGGFKSGSAHRIQPFEREVPLGLVCLCCRTEVAENSEKER